MGKKKLKLFQGQGFSTVNASPLGQILNLLEAKLAVLLSAKNKYQPSLELTHSIKQLTAIKSHLENIKYLMSYFSEGNGPGLMSAGFAKTGYELSDSIKNSTDFDTADFAIFRVIKKDLTAAIAASINQTKIKQFNVDNVEEFKIKLKSELKRNPQNRFAEAAKIPGYNPDQFFNFLDQSIDTFFFQKYNQANAIDFKLLGEGFTEAMNLKLFDFSNPLHTFKQADFSITHPIVYDFIIEVLELLSEAPNVLSELVTFLKPSAITEGVLPSIVEKLAGLVIENNPKTDSPYIYTIKQNGQPIIFPNNIANPIDVGGLYNAKIGNVKKQSALSIANYYQNPNYANTPHVRSELAKANLVQKFITKEKLLVDKCEDMANLYVQDMSKYVAENFLTSSNFQAQVETIEDLVQTLSSIKEDIAYSMKRETIYDEKPVASLIIRYQDLVNELKLAGNEGVDTSFIDLPLPEKCIIPVNNGFELVAVRDALAIDGERMRSLLELHDNLVTKITDLKNQLQAAVDEWHKQEIAVHQKTNHVHRQRLDALVEKALSFVNEEEKLPEDLDARLQFIEEQLDLRGKQSEVLSDFSGDVQELQVAINQPAKCPEQLVKHDSTISAAIDHCYHLTRQQAQQSMGEFAKVAQGLEDQKAGLLTLRNKTLAAKSLAETMKSADPTVIVELIRAKESEHLDLGLKHQQLSEKMGELVIKSESYDNLLYRNADPLVNNADPLVALKEQSQLVKNGVLKALVTVEESLISLSLDAGQIFTEEAINTYDGAKAAKDWLDLQLPLYKALLENTSKLGSGSKESSILLKAMDKTIAVIMDSKGGIPFKLLDKRLEADDVFDISIFSLTKGFNHLLDQLKDSYHTEEKWAKHRESSANSELVLADTTSLLNLLNKKALEIHNAINLENKLQVFQLNNTNLETFASKIDVLVSTFKDLEKEKQARKQYAEEEKELGKEMISLDAHIDEIEKNLGSLEQSINILNQIAELLTLNQGLSGKIAEIEAMLLEFPTVDLLNANQQSLTSKMVSAKTTLTQLEKLVAKLELAITELENKTMYQDNANKIKALLDTSKQKIAKIVQDICVTKQDDLLADIGSNAQELEAIAGVNIPQDEKFEQLTCVSGLLSRTVALIEKANQSVAKKKYLLNDLQELTVDEMNLSDEVVNLHLLPSSAANKLMPNFLTQIDTLLDRYTAELNLNQEKVNTLAVDEAKASQESNVTKLKEASDYLAALPLGQLGAIRVSLVQLPESEAAMAQLDVFAQAAELLSQRVELKTAVNEKLALRIQERERFADKFNLALRTYIDQRKLRYPVKDTFFSGDLGEREEFVTNLSLALDNYAASGNSKDVFDCINQRDKPFWGFNLQPIINRLILNIKELDKAIHGDYESMPVDAVEGELVDRHTDALEILEVLKNNASLEFVDGVTALYEKIDLINEFAVDSLDGDDQVVATTLATTLSKQVDLFIINNQQLFNEQGEVNQKKDLLLNFQTDFLCQLHSQDDVLSKHKSWEPIVNFILAALAVLSVGITLIPQAIVRKVILGRDSMFFKPEAIRTFEEIGDAVHEIAAPAA